MRPERQEDWPQTQQFVKVDKTFIDPTYQRPETRLVKKIAEDFDPYVFGAPILSRRHNSRHDTKDDDRFAIIDGQQRISGARMIGVPSIPGLVFTGLRVQDEARMFVKIQVERLNIRPVQRFRGELAARFPRALAIKNSLDRRDIELSENSGRNASPDSLAAVGALEEIYDRFGLDTLDLTLDVITAAWPQMRGRFRGEIIRAVGQFISQDEPHSSRLIATLTAARLGTPDSLMERSAARRKGEGLGGGSIGYTVEVIRGDYKRTKMMRTHV